MIRFSKRIAGFAWIAMIAIASPAAVDISLSGGASVRTSRSLRASRTVCISRLRSLSRIS